MDSFLQMLEIQSVQFIYLFVGYGARKWKLVTDAGRRCITDLLIYIFLPCMVLSSFLQDISVQQLISAAWILAVGFAVSFAAIILGNLLYRRYPLGKQQILRCGTLVANSGLIGLPLAHSVYGPLGLFYASVYVIPTRIFVWSAGVSMFSDADSKTRIKNVLLNPGIIAVFLGIPMMLLHLKLPSILGSAVDTLGACTTSIAMLTVGTILADTDIKTIFDRDVFLLSGVRLIVMPLLTLGICAIFRLDATASAVAALLTGMPVGSTTTILAAKYGADASFASKCVFVSTLLSLITIPLLSILL